MMANLTRVCLPFVFVMKNACSKKQGNRPFFKEKCSMAGCVIRTF